MLVVLSYSLARVRDGKVSAFHAGLRFCLIVIAFLVVAILVPINMIIKVWCITMGGLVLIYAMTLFQDGFGRSESEAAVWIFYMMCAATVTAFFTLCMDLPNTKKSLRTFAIGVASGSLPWVYPVLMERLNKGRDEG